MYTPAWLTKRKQFRAINDFLATAAVANSERYTSNTYTFTKIGTCPLQNIQTVMARHLQCGVKDQVILTHLEPWDVKLFTFNPRFPDNHETDTVWFHASPNEWTGNMSPKAHLLHLLSDFFGNTSPIVYHMLVTTEAYYACSYEDYLFYDPSSSTLYHLGFRIDD